MPKILEEPTIVAPDPVINVQPKGDLETMELGGSEFETKLRAAEEKAAQKKTAEAAEPPPTKKDAPAKEDKPAKGKTPLDTAPVEKKPEPPPVEEELKTLIASEPPPNASASSTANHAAMRRGLERANATITELKAERDILKNKPAAAPAEIEERLKAAEQAVKERDETLERIAFERSPRFQKFVSEGEAELAAAKSYLPEGSEINPNVIDLAAKAVGAKRIAILTEAGLEPGMIAAVTSNLSRLDAINRERESAITNWKEQQTQWTAEQQRAHESKAAQIKANEDKVFQSVGKKVAETLAPFQRVEGNNEWNTGVDQRLQEAQEFFDGKKPLTETSQLIYEGIAGRVYKDAFEDLRTKYNDLVADNERTKAARPGAAGTSPDSGVVADTKTDPMALAGDTFDQQRAKHGG